VWPQESMTRLFGISIGSESRLYCLAAGSLYPLSPFF